MAIRASDFVSPEKLVQPGPLENPGEIPDNALRASDFVNLPQQPDLDRGLFGELTTGVAAGTEGLIQSFFGVAALAGRGLGIETLEGFGKAGIQRTQFFQSRLAPEIGSLEDIEGAGDFFKFAAQGIGQALPSLALMVGSGGVGGAIAKKAIETQLKRFIMTEMRKTLAKKGFSKAAASDAVTRAFQSQFAKKMLLDGITKGTPNVELLATAFSRGAAQAVLPASALPQIGQIDIELQAAGKDAGLTAILAGTTAGFLDALPALKLLGRMFPGVATNVAKNYVKDVAVAAGAQALLEGSTEGAQEMIAIAALAFHDPSFDPFSRESAFRVADSFAIGAMVGAVTGAGAQAFGSRDRTPAKVPKPGEKRNIPLFRFEDEKPSTLPEDFNPADNTFFEEVRDRVNTAVGAVLNPIFNSTRDKAQGALDALDVDFKGQLNKIGAKISKLVDKIQTDFINANRGDIEQVKQFASGAAQSIYESARRLTDPQAREAFIQRGLDQVQSKVDQLTEALQKKADTSGKTLGATVGSFEDLEALFDKKTQAELQEPGDPAVAELQEDVPIRHTFGKDKTGGVVRGDNNLFQAEDPNAAVGWQTKELARRQMLKLRKQFPSVPDSAWAITEKEDGTFVIEVSTNEANQLLTDDATLNEGIESARISARGARDTARPRAKIPSVDRPGQKTTVDLITLAQAGRDLNEQAVTIRQGLITALGRLFDRGGLSREEFNRAVRTYDAAFPQEKAERTKFNIGPQGQDADVRLRPDLSDPVDRQDAARSRELDQAFVDPDAIPIGDEPDNEGAAKLLSEAQEARRAAREAAVPAPVTKQPEAEQQPTVEVIASPESEAAMGADLKALVERFVKLLTVKGTTVTVVETRKRQDIATDPKTPSLIRQLMSTLEYMIMEALSPASVHYDVTTKQVTIFIHDFTKNKGETIALLMHELGHVIHYDTWTSLNKAEQDALWDAFKKDVKAGRTTGAALQTEVEGFENLVDPNTPSKLNMFEFREWMADQFVLWAAGRSKPVGALKKFLEKVGAKLQQLYDFINNNPGRYGKLNETFAQFADAVAKKAVGLNPPGVNYFIREGAAGRGFESIASTALSEVEVSDLNEIDAFLEKLEAGTLTEADIVISSIARIPAKQKTALEKRLAKFPAIMKNMQVMNRWVKNAWDLALSPATHVMRQIGERVPVVNEIANIFGRNIGKAKTSQNYHDRVDQMRGSFRAKFEIITKGMSTVEKEALARRLQELDSTNQSPANLRERQMRKFFDDLLVYIRESGLPLAEVQNYFPRAFNYDLLINDEKKIIAHLRAKGMSLDQARGFYQSLLSPEMRSHAALGRQTPAFKNMRSRTLTDPFFKRYQSESLDGTVSNYINSAVKRAEYNRFLGEKAPKGATRADDLKKSTWNPKGKLEAFLDKARDQGATDEDLKTIGMYIDAQLGMLGRDSKIAQKFRTPMAAMIAYQNMRLLMFTVFASLPDLVGPAIRAGSMKDAFKSLSGNMQLLMKSETDIADMARAFGLISSEASNHIMTEYVDNHFMPPGLRRMNEAFFKWTGLNWYTDFTRKMALVVGIDYIKNMAERSTNPNIKSRDRIKAQAALKELGITKAAVDSWAADGEPVWGSFSYTKTGAAARADQAVAESLVQFVNESIMRPNASQRPIMASHPNAMLVFHLKGYMFAMWEVVGKRMIHNVKLSKTDYQTSAALMPAVAILALTAAGLELRELMQYAFTGRTPPTDRMDGLQYMGTLIDRSGLLGQGQMVFDGAQGDLAFLSGPTIGQLAELMQGRASLTRSIPILSQMPSLRQAL